MSLRLRVVVWCGGTDGMGLACADFDTELMEAVSMIVDEEEELLEDHMAAITVRESHALFSRPLYPCKQSAGTSGACGAPCPWAPLWCVGACADLPGERIASR